MSNPNFDTRYAKAADITSAINAQTAANAGLYQPISKLAHQVTPVGEYLFQPAASVFGGWDPGEANLAVTSFFVNYGTYDQIIFNITNAGSTGSLARAVVYADTGGRPGLLLSDSPVVDGTTNGIKSAILNNSLVIPQSGTFVWAGVISQGAATTRCQYSRHLSYTTSSFSSNQLYMFTGNYTPNYSISGITGAPPANLSSASHTGDSGVRVGLRRAS